VQFAIAVAAYMALTGLIMLGFGLAAFEVEFR
jgi:hypothetical protein